MYPLPLPITSAPSQGSVLRQSQGSVMRRLRVPLRFATCSFPEYLLRAICLSQITTDSPSELEVLLSEVSNFSLLIEVAQWEGGERERAAQWREEAGTRRVGWGENREEDDSTERKVGREREGGWHRVGEQTKNRSHLEGAKGRELHEKKDTETHANTRTHVKRRSLWEKHENGTVTETGGEREMSSHVFTTAPTHSQIELEGQGYNSNRRSVGPRKKRKTLTARQKHRDAQR